MKSTGITRKIDELGRIVLPVEMRRVLEISEGDPLEIFVGGGGILLKKYRPSCVFCNNSSDITLFKGKFICEKCKADMK